MKEATVVFPHQLFKDHSALSKRQQIDLPFEAFQPEYLRCKLDPSTLKRIAVVAIGEEFQADIAVSRIEFY